MKVARIVERTLRIREYEPSLIIFIVCNTTNFIISALLHYNSLSVIHFNSSIKKQPKNFRFFVK